MTIFNVSNASELNSALGNAQGGDTIVLASGNYGTLDFRSKFESTVTITSADHSAPAEFTSIKMNGAQNVVFDNMKFNYTYTDGDNAITSPFEIRNSNNITVQNSEIVGDDDNSGYGSGSGLFLIDSHHINLENNLMHNWLRGIKVDRCTDLKVTGNELHSMAGDGMNFAAVQRVLIENNHIHDFDADPASGYHRDMIQFWTAGIKEPNTDIVIRGNLMDIGSGAWTQSIFMRNELVDTGQAGQEMHYQNVVIEDNTIYNLHLHGITMGETDNLVIRNNTILQAGDETNPNNAGRDGAVVIPRMNLAETSNDVTVADNITSSIHGYNGQSNWTVDGNVLVQKTDPNGDNYYGKVFQNADQLEGGGAHSAVAVEGSLIDQTDAGSGRIQPENQTGGDQTGGDQTGGDQTGGDQAGGDDSDVVDAVGVVSGDLVFNLSDMLEGQKNALRGDTVFEDGVVKLDGDHDYVRLGRLKDLEDSTQIAFSVTYSRENVDSGSERLVWNHKKLGVSLHDDDLIIHVANTERPFWDGFRIKDLGLDDVKEHTIQVLANQDTDELKVYVDGKLVLEEYNVDLDFVGAGGGEWGWMISTPWNDFFDGHVSDFSVGTDLSMPNETSNSGTEAKLASQTSVTRTGTTTDEYTIDFTALDQTDEPIGCNFPFAVAADQHLRAGQAKNSDAQNTVVLDPFAEQLKVVMASEPAPAQNDFFLAQSRSALFEKTTVDDSPAVVPEQWEDILASLGFEPEHIDTTVPGSELLF